ncbi:MAG: hypothetical protein ACE5OZ_21390, partial [Candidatus Heimdallarchaeota archaeon]
MASREVSTIRVELPYTAAIFCAVIQQPGKRGFDLDFIQDGKVIHKEMSVDKDADLVVELLVTAQIEFISFSAVYQAGDMIVEAMEKLEAGEGEIIEKDSEIDQIEETDTAAASTGEITSDEDLSEIETSQQTPISSADETSEEDSVEIALQEDETAETAVPEEEAALKADAPLKEINVEYSEAIVQLYYDGTAEEFSVAVWDQNEIKLDRIVIPNDEDAILDVIIGANLELQSMSVLFDVASEIKGIVDDPSSFLQPEKSQEGEIEGEEEEIGVETDSEEELPDVSLLKEPSDVETFIEVTKKSLQLERQILIREEPIKDMKGVVCRIFRKGDDEWFLGFKTKGEEETQAKKLPEVTLDDVARAMNNGIPQISFSMLYDAAEDLFSVIERLAARPADDMVIQQTVNHFSQVISEYENEGNLEKAQEVAATLMKTFFEMNKARGYSEFALKVSQFMDSQEKFVESAKLRMQVVDSLHGMGDVDSTRDFVEKSLAAMQSEKQGQHLAAAKLAAKMTDILLTERNLNATDAASKAIDYYKLADLPTSVTEYSLDFGKRLLNMAYGEDAIEDLKDEKRDMVADKAAELFHIALEMQDERKDRFELLEGLESILEWFKEYECNTQLINFSERGITYFEEYDEPEKALELVEDLAIRLMSEETYVKALDFVNKAVRIYYEKDDLNSAVSMGLQVVDKLIEIEQKETAVQYLDFVQDLGEKAFGEKQPEKIQELSLKCVERLTSLGELERAVNSVKSAANSESDPQKAAEICSEQAKSILEHNHLVPAQELVNYGIEKLLEEGFHQNAGNLSLNLSDALFDKEQYPVAMNYLEYANSCLEATENPDYLSQILVEHSIKFITANMTEKVTAMVEKAISHYCANEEFEKGIDAHEKLANKLLENELFDDAFIQVVRGAALFEQMEQVEEASSFLTGYRNKYLEKGRLDDARELTDFALKRSVSALSDHKAGIHIVTPFIEKLVESKDFENGYLYAVQNVRYYENLGDIEGATQFILKYREELLNQDLFRDAAEMTSLITRLNTRHGHTETAMELAQQFADMMQEKDQMDLYAEYASRVSDLQSRNIGDEDKAIKTLRESAEVLLETAPEESLEVIEKIVGLLEKIDREDAKNAYISYVEKLMSLGHQKVSTKLAKEVIEYIRDDEEDRALAFSLEYASALIEKKKGEDSLYFVLLVIGHWIEKDPEKADTIGNEHALRLLEVGEADSADKIVQKLSTHAEDTGKLTRLALRFVRQLVENGFVENSRDHLDMTIKLLGEKIKSKQDFDIASSRIYEKFAKLVANASPDLAREYSYRAADQYRRNRDFEGVARVHLELSYHLEPAPAAKVLKRGMEKSKGSKDQASQIMLQKELTTRTIGIGKPKEVSKDIRKLLEMYEASEELEESLFTLAELLIKLIGRGEYGLAEDFGNYSLKLSQIVGRAAGLNTVLSRLATAYQNEERIDDRDRIKDMIRSLPESDTDDELARLGIEMIREKPAMPETPELKDVEPEAVEPEAVEPEAVEP